MGLHLEKYHSVSDCFFAKCHSHCLRLTFVLGLLMHKLSSTSLSSCLCLCFGFRILDSDCAQVWEETGLRTNFNSILCFWNRHHLEPWGQSDIYIVAHLTPADEATMHDFNMDPQEISACQWMDIDEFIRTEDHPLILKILQESVGVPVSEPESERSDSDSERALDVVDPAAKMERVEVQWPGRPRIPTYVAKAR